MSALVKKILGKSIQNIIVISLTFGIYLLSLAFGLPIIIQLMVMATVLLAFLNIGEDNPPAA